MSMRKYVIAVSGDNDALHEKALAAAVLEVEKINNAPVYRAWVERVEYVPSDEREGSPA